MTIFFLEYRNIFVFIVCSFALAIVLLAAVYILSFTSKVDLEKSSAYECGFQPFSETSFPFEVQFAVIAIMFLLFDIEVLYLFPLISSLYSLFSLDVFIVLGFYIILLIGLLFEISRKVLDFNKIEA
jgi:NADH:ubiquinone oxidoreductase subunit 3 (subunit A)